MSWVVAEYLHHITRCNY